MTALVLAAVPQHGNKPSGTAQRPLKEQQLRDTLCDAGVQPETENTIPGMQESKESPQSSNVN